MPFTYDDWLPSDAELKTEEINMSAAPLRAAAHHMGKFCDHESKEFMLCRKEEEDPRKCIPEGKEVTRCGLKFLRKLKQTCAEEFTTYWNCIDRSGEDMNFKNCRKTQGVYDKCVLANFGQERPDLGHFTKVRIHDSKRTQPEHKLPLPEPTPDPVDPKTAPVPESTKLGSRWWFLP